MKPLPWNKINPLTGKPFKWGDKNLRWGSPSYYLEPGDPGFVPYSVEPPPSNPETKTKKKHMPKSDYIKNADDAFAAQLNTFKTNIPNYATIVGVSAAQVTAQAADADDFAYVLACQKLMLNGAQQWTAWKNLLRNGGTPPPGGAPVPPVFPVAITGVALGIEARFRALVQQIKKHTNYNEAIGQALGIEGDVQTGPDMSSLAPVLWLELTSGGVILHWDWQGYSAFLDICEILVDRNDGKGYVMLVHDTTPDYIDTYPLPAVPTKWKYKSTYRVGDERVGQWSNEVAITVGG